MDTFFPRRDMGSGNIVTSGGVGSATYPYLVSQVGKMRVGEMGRV